MNRRTLLSTMTATGIAIASRSQFRSARAQSDQGNFILATDGEKLKVVINGETQEVRFIGVDAPEMSKGDNTTECFARDARDYLNTILAGQVVRLESDTEDKDGKDRLWRYVWAYVDGVEVLLNEQVLALGLAQTQEEEKNTKYQDKLLAAEKSAKSASLGLWGTCQSPHEEIPRHGSADDPAQWGETIDADGVAVTPSDPFLSYDYAYSQPKAGYVYLIFTAYVQNVGGGNKGYSSGRFLAKDMSRDVEHKETFLLFDQGLDSGDLSQGSYAAGSVAIELQDGATNLRIKYQVNALGGPSLYWLLQL
jgi:micrococcal nuclease